MDNITNHITDHPYYPKHAEIASYLANEYSVTVLLSTFTILCLSIVMGTLFVVKQSYPNLPGLEKAAIWWFVTCKQISLHLSGSADNYSSWSYPLLLRG
jgi:cholestenol delta-isomerase